MFDDASPPPDEHADDIRSLPKAVAALLQDLPGMLTDRVHLLALELRRATSALAQMIALVLVAAILGATAWIALWVGFVAALMAVGFGWGWAVLVVLLVNLGVAGWALARVKALAPLLALPATLRRLTDSDSRERNDARKTTPTAQPTP